MRHELELRDGSSQKFWHIELSGTSHTVWWGRIGTNGQTQTKDFASEAEAKKSFDKLLRAKRAKGYADVSGAQAATAAPAPAKPAPKKAAAKAAAPATKAPAPEQDDPPPAAPASIAGAETVMALTSGDWAWATWRAPSAMVRPDPAPFDREACLARVASLRTSQGGYHVHWEQAGIPIGMTEEEALFWVAAFTAGIGRKLKPRDAAKRLASAEPLDGGDALLERVKKAFAESGEGVGSVVFRPLAALFTSEALFRFTQATYQPGRNLSAGWQTSTMVLQGYREEVLPYVPAADRAALRSSLTIPTSFTWASFYDRPPFELFAGAMVGHPDIAAIVASIPDGHYGGDDWTDHYHQPQLLCFGLPSPDDLLREMKRLRLSLKRPDHVRAWLAHFETSGHDFARASIQAIKNKDDANALTDALGLAIAPETAPAMLALKYESKATLSAGAWLDAHPEHAVAGLVPVAHKSGRLADLAVEHLRALKAKGWGEAIAHAAEAASASRVIRDVVEWTPKHYRPMAARPAWLADALAAFEPPKKAKKLPAWLDLATLPPLVVADEQLDEEAAATVLAASMASSLDDPPALLRELRAHGDADALDAFAWKIFDAWLAADAPSKERWALDAVGFLGGDASVLRLTPMVRAWPGESQHKRAVQGLDVLRAIGSDLALMQIHGIAQKLKFKALKQAAREAMDAIASARSMTRDELEDRIVPDCDLDERGTRVLDFGPRQFRVVLDEDMKPAITDESGKPRKDLPKPGAKDDPALAAASVAAWKLLKKQLKDVVAIQGPRLELAMATGRRWDPKAFELLLVRHPLMTSFVKRLVWAGYDAKGALVRTFRVTPEGTYADERDDETTLDGVAAVGLVHAYHLDEASAAAWGGVLADYEIVQPFAQLGRPLYGLEPGEAKAQKLVRFAGTKLSAAGLVGKLERAGWLRGIPEDAGVFYQHFKPFWAAEVTAIARYEGVPVGYMVDWDDQSIDEVFFVAGAYTPDTYPWKSTPCRSARSIPW